MAISFLDAVLAVIIGNTLSFGVLGYGVYTFRGVIKEKFMSDGVDEGLERAQDMAMNMAENMLGGNIDKDKIDEAT